MRLLADEGVDAQIVQRLRAEGHDVLSVAEEAAGIEDENILRAANEDRRLLLTGDKDFGELVFRQGRASAGVILVRLAGFTAQRKANLVSAILVEHHADLLGAFTVVSPGGLRIRRSWSTR